MIRALLLMSLLATRLALAQTDDGPIPYPEAEQDSEDAAPSGSLDRPSANEARDEVMAGTDDPNLGLAAEVMLGALLLDSPRGRFVEPRLGAGARLTWEYGRLLNIEALREALWADLQWTYTNLRNGTELVATTSHFHYFTLAPAYELTVGEEKNYGFYAQLGAGLAYERNGLLVGRELTRIDGVRPLFQYGLGFRGRPVLVEAPNVRLSFRVEVTRFRRGYFNDTFLGGSLGAAF